MRVSGVVKFGLRFPRGDSPDYLDMVPLARAWWHRTDEPDEQQIEDDSDVSEWVACKG